MRRRGYVWILGLSALIALATACQPKEGPQEQAVSQSELTVGRGLLTWVEAPKVPLPVMNRYQAEMPTTSPAAIFQYARDGRVVYLFVVKRQADQQWVLMDISEKGVPIGPAQTRETAPLLPASLPVAEIPGSQPAPP